MCDRGDSIRHPATAPSALPPPEQLDPLMVDREAPDPQQGRNSPIAVPAVLAGQPDHPRHQPWLVVRDVGGRSAASSGAVPTPGTPDAARRGRGRARGAPARTPRATSPGSVFPRGGLPEDGLVQSPQSSHCGRTRLKGAGQPARRLIASTGHHIRDESMLGPRFTGGIRPNRTGRGAVGRASAAGACGRRGSIGIRGEGRSGGMSASAGRRIREAPPDPGTGRSHSA